MSIHSERFWILAHPDTRRGLLVALPTPFRLEVCPVNPGHRDVKHDEPLKVLVKSDPKYDFMWTYDSDLLLTERVQAMFEEQRFTGYRLKPVNVVARRKRATPGMPASEQPEPPSLYELIRTGWGGMAKPESGIRLLEKCAGCNWQLYTDFSDPRYLVDTEQWDGSDFMVVWPMPVFVFVTDRVAQFIKREKLTGAELIHVDQLRFPENMAAGFGPGRLREWLDDEYARKVGEPLGIY